MGEDEHGESGPNPFEGGDRPLEMVLDGANVGLFVLGPEFTIEWINESIGTYFDLSRDDVVGRDKRRVLEDELQGVFEQPHGFVEQVLESYDDGDHATDVTCHVSGGEDRADRWLRYQSHPIDTGRLAGGRIEQYTDVTDRTLDRRRKHEAIDQAPIGITLTDPQQADNPLVYANEEFVSLTGYSREEVSGWNHRNLQGPETREEPVAELRRAVEAEEATTVELRNYRKDGTQFWNRVSIAPIRDATDRLQSWVGFQEDITERKSHEQQLQRQNKRLDEFASVVSHDLRNPLQVARGRLEILRGKFDSEHLDVIERSHEQMERLIDDLLALARSEESMGEPEPLDLPTVVDECWRNIAAAEASLEVETDLTVRADSTLLQQLLENLIGNAVEHGGPGVTVTVGETDDGFYVADTGPGIPPDEREKVFESGYSTTERGTGFGLAIVREVAVAHGWTVDTTESESGGARFEITGLDGAWDTPM